LFRTDRFYEMSIGRGSAGYVSYQWRGGNISKANFDEVTNISQTASTSGSTSTLAYHLKIPEADIDVEFFSVARMTQLMGPSQATFRLIAQMALWLGALYMVYNSIDRRLQVTNVGYGFDD